ncbi:hypothetical protein F7725_015860 [Dissostichus mawsoni]|uniref:Uncharacterized protein n=1 Tax=Dissostichus mawsoni TaxID=36200 RepID=A0A7J5YJM9_DISMA|nr:hypothetical protein F7725_015860 [Dissostichus mawsoni]
MSGSHSPGGSTITSSRNSSIPASRSCLSFALDLGQRPQHDGLLQANKCHEGGFQEVHLSNQHSTCTGNTLANVSEGAQVGLLGLVAMLSVEASRSSMMVPFSMHVLSSIRLCRDSVAT